MKLSTIRELYYYYDAKEIEDSVCTQVSGVLSGVLSASINTKGIYYFFSIIVTIAKQNRPPAYYYIITISITNIIIILLLFHSYS